MCNGICYAIPMTDRKTAIIDFEASALWGGYPIEVGIAKFHRFQGLHVPRDIQSTGYIIRHDSWLRTGHWDPKAQAIHGLTKDGIFASGDTVRKIAYRLNEELADSDVYADSDFDVGWNEQVFAAAGIAPSFKIGHVRDIFAKAVFINEDCVRETVRGPTHKAEEDARRIALAIMMGVVRPEDELHLWEKRQADAPHFIM